MDKSETYIKMSDCEEIQDLAPEFYNVELTGTPPFSEPVTLVHQEFFIPRTFKEVDIMVWLPRQDELQVMMLPDPKAKDAWGDPVEHDYKTDYVFWLVQSFANSIQERKRSQQTMEQLWLRFVMKEKFGKIWSNDEWIKE